MAQMQHQKFSLQKVNKVVAIPKKISTTIAIATSSNE
jgi:hypothetical protein